MIYYGLLLLIFFDYLRPESYVPFLKSSIYLPILLFLASFAREGEVSNEELLGKSNSRWMIFFLALTVVSMVFSDVTQYSFGFFKVVVGYLFLYFLIIKEVNDEEKIEKFFAILVVIHVVLIVLNPALVLDPTTRSYVSQAAFLGDGNDFAWSLCIVVPFTFYLFQRAESALYRGLTLGAVLLFLLTIIGTSSRGATIGMAAVLLYLWFKSEQKIWGLAGILLLGIVVIQYAPESYFERMETIVDYQGEGSAMSRLDTWEAAVRMAKDHPLLGVGTDHFAMKYGRRYGLGEYAGRWLNAHSIYFKILGELGIPGLLFLVSIIFSSFLSVEGMYRETPPERRSRRSLYVSLNAGLLGFAVPAAFLSGIKYPHLYVVIGLITAAQLLHDRELEAADGEQFEEHG